MIIYRLGNPLVRKRIKLEYHACRKSTDCDLCDSLADIAGVENVQEACIYKIQREQFSCHTVSTRMLTWKRLLIRVPTHESPCNYLSPASVIHKHMIPQHKHLEHK